MLFSIRSASLRSFLTLTIKTCCCSLCFFPETIILQVWSAGDLSTSCCCCCSSRSATLLVPCPSVDQSFRSGRLSEDPVQLTLK
ncbi:hypothetical protein BpHYR1_021959 [Brachionus plicatilis]|uniref:Secreted protein n=1 Tax=Brachionus plicatilis TaxID=10195 RepID=A0A3M7QQC2_BRAPC|nr:hypothetical protein BpHYR1_021959 [Brachionus plicatilis]